MIIGERGNGKTYGAKSVIINNFIETRRKFAYVRRRQEQITRRDMKRLFTDISDECLKPDVLGDFIKYTVELGFYIDGDDGKPIVMGYPFAIENSTFRKGIPWNDINVIFVDEFLEYGNPIADEVSQFMNLISTIVRKRTDVEIIMCANTVTKMSPFFTLFGIDLKKLKQGQIYTFSHQNGVTGAIEWCASSNIMKDGSKISDKYLGFDNNPTSSMILYGEWEYDKVNTLKVDGIGWNSNRRLVPFYLTGIGEVYEFSVYEDKNPVLFVRKINTQNGLVREEIKYNISYDLTVALVSKNGIVPTYGAVCDLLDEECQGWWRIIRMCIEGKRVVYSKMSDGSDFMRIYQNLRKGG